MHFRVPTYSVGVASWLLNTINNLNACPLEKSNVAVESFAFIELRRLIFIDCQHYVRPLNKHIIQLSQFYYSAISQHPVSVFNFVSFYTLQKPEAALKLQQNYNFLMQQ